MVLRCCPQPCWTPLRPQVEDLFELLASVLVRFPDVDAVSCGAILSNYQRLRVEHCCRRLGLTVRSL